MTTFTNTQVVNDAIAGYPCAGPITLHFGEKDDLHPSGHSGLDIGASAGVAILAPADGVVSDVFSVLINSPAWDQWKSIFGNSVIIDHGDCYTLYAHMQSPPSVREGQQVKAGDLLGYVGQTGEATGPHLHWGMAEHDNRYFQFGSNGPVGTLLNVLDYVVQPAPTPEPLPVQSIFASTANVTETETGLTIELRKL